MWSSTQEGKPKTREAEMGKGSVGGTVISWLLGRRAGESWGLYSYSSSSKFILRTCCGVLSTVWDARLRETWILPVRKPQARTALSSQVCVLVTCDRNTVEANLTQNRVGCYGLILGRFTGGEPRARCSDGVVRNLPFPVLSHLYSEILFFHDHECIQSFSCLKKTQTNANTVVFLYGIHR